MAELTKAEVLAKFDVCPSTLWRWIKSGAFPKATRKESNKRQWWDEDVVDAWMSTSKHAEISDNKALARARQVVCDFVCSVTGNYMCMESTITKLLEVSPVYGDEQVSKWFRYSWDMVTKNNPRATEEDLIKYFCGILRNQRTRMRTSAVPQIKKVEE